MVKKLCGQGFSSCIKYYLSAKNQEHSVISTCVGARQNIEFLSTKQLVF